MIFKDTVKPMCPANDGLEDAEHFLLSCPSFGVQRQNILAGILPLLRPLGYTNLLTQLQLYDDYKDKTCLMHREFTANIALCK